MRVHYIRVQNKCARIYDMAKVHIHVYNDKRGMQIKLFYYKCFFFEGCCFRAGSSWGKKQFISQYKYIRAHTHTYRCFIMDFNPSGDFDFILNIKFFFMYNIDSEWAVKNNNTPKGVLETIGIRSDDARGSLVVTFVVRVVSTLYSTLKTEMFSVRY